MVIVITLLIYNKKNPERYRIFFMHLVYKYLQKQRLKLKSPATARLYFHSIV